MKNQTNPVSLLDDKVKCKYLATVFAGENLTPVFFFVDLMVSINSFLIIIIR